MNGPDGPNTVASAVPCRSTANDAELCGTHGGAWVGIRPRSACSMVYASPAEIADALVKLDRAGVSGARARGGAKRANGR